MADRSIRPRERLQWGMQGVDWQERINYDRLRQQRYARAVAKLKQNGVAAAILHGANQRYATSVMASWVAELSLDQGGCAVVFADSPIEDSVVFAMGSTHRQMKINCPWIKSENIRASNTFLPYLGRKFAEEQASQQAARIVQDLKEKGLGKEKIGYDVIHPRVKAGLEKQGIHLVSVMDALEEARMIKTVDEINLMKQAGIVADQVWWAIYEHLRPGITECELAAEVVYTVEKAQPVAPLLVLICSGPNMASLYLGCQPTDRVILPGDLVYSDVGGPLANGYRSCYCRTFKCGALPTRKEKDWYRQAYEWLTSAEDACKPGNTTADVAACWPSCTAWGGPNAAEIDYMPLCIGHGIGLGQHEWPMISRMSSLNEPQPIQEGMVIALETWQGEEGVGAVRIEDIIAVTDKGYEVIAGNWPLEELVAPQHSLVYNFPYGA